MSSGTPQDSFDPRFEFDAPRYVDFAATSPLQNEETRNRFFGLGEKFEMASPEELIDLEQSGEVVRTLEFSTESVSETVNVPSSPAQTTASIPSSPSLLPTVQIEKFERKVALQTEENVDQTPSSQDHIQGFSPVESAAACATVVENSSIVDPSSFLAPVKRVHLVVDGQIVLMDNENETEAVGADGAECQTIEIEEQEAEAEFPRFARSTAAARARMSVSMERERGRDRKSVGGTKRKAPSRSRSRSASVSRQSLPSASSTRLMEPTASSRDKVRVPPVTPSRAKRNSIVNQAARAALTTPLSPQFSTKNRIRGPSVSSTEAMELAAIEAKKEEMKKRLQENAKTIEAALAPHGEVLPARSLQPLTKPAEFRFATDARLGQRRTSVVEEAPKKKARIGELTKFEPFHFVTEQRISAKPKSGIDQHQQHAHTDATPREFVPLCNQVSNVLVRSDAPSAASNRLSIPALTKPEPFHLSTLERPKRDLGPSTEQLEIEALKAIPPFKARPLNEKILASSGDIGLIRTDKPKPTEFHEFQFETSRRSVSRRSSVQSSIDDEEFKYFKAMPLNKHIFEVDPREKVETVVRSRRPSLVVEPFQLATDSRANSPTHKRKSEVHEDFHQFKARPMPDLSTPRGLPEAAKKPTTHLAPFNLNTEQRGQYKTQAFQERVVQEEEAMQRARQFMARDIKVVSTPLTAPRGQAPTQPQPFHLRSVELHEEAQAILQAKLQQELEAEKAAKNFKAAPMPALDTPFTPRPSDRPLTEVLPIQLASDVRAEVRKEFDEVQRERRAEAENALALKKAEEERLALEAEREHLKSVAFKARPIMQGKPMELHKSDKPLTEACSPNFATKHRVRARTPFGEVHDN